MIMKKKAAPDASRGGPKDYLCSDDLPEFLVGKKAKLFFLHIDREQQEIWFDSRPQLVPTVPIWRHDGWEYYLAPMITRTSSGEEMPEPLGPFGKRWKWRGATPDGVRVLFTRKVAR